MYGKIAGAIVLVIVLIAIWYWWTRDASASTSASTDAGAHTDADAIANGASTSEPEDTGIISAITTAISDAATSVVEAVIGPSAPLPDSGTMTGPASDIMVNLTITGDDGSEYKQTKVWSDNNGGGLVEIDGTQYAISVKMTWYTLVIVYHKPPATITADHATAVKKVIDDASAPKWYYMVSIPEEAGGIGHALFKHIDAATVTTLDAATGSTPESSLPQVAQDFLAAVRVHRSKFAATAATTHADTAATVQQTSAVSPITTSTGASLSPATTSISDPIGAPAAPAAAPAPAGGGILGAISDAVSSVVGAVTGTSAPEPPATTPAVPVNPVTHTPAVTVPAVVPPPAPAPVAVSMPAPVLTPAPAPVIVAPKPVVVAPAPTVVPAPAPPAPAVIPVTVTPTSTSTVSVQAYTARPNGSILRSPDGKIYLIYGGKRYHFTATSYSSCGSPTFTNLAQAEVDSHAAGAIQVPSCLATGGANAAIRALAGAGAIPSAPLFAQIRTDGDITPGTDLFAITSAATPESCALKCMQTKNCNAYSMQGAKCWGKQSTTVFPGNSTIYVANDTPLKPPPPVVVYKDANYSGAAYEIPVTRPQNATLRTGPNSAIFKEIGAIPKSAKIPAGWILTSFTTADCSGASGVKHTANVASFPAGVKCFKLAGK